MALRMPRRSRAGARRGLAAPCSLRGSAALRPRLPPSRILPPGRRCARAELRPLERQAHQQRGTVVRGLPEIVPARPFAPRRERPPPEPGPPGGRCAGRWLGGLRVEPGQLGVKRGGSFGRQPRLQPPPYLRVRRRRHGQGRERRPHVQAGAARPPAPSPVLARSSSIRGRAQSGVLRRREGLARVDASDQLVRTPLHLGGGRLVRKHREAPVDLHGVAGDDPRPPAARPAPRATAVLPTPVGPRSRSRCPGAPAAGRRRCRSRPTPRAPVPSASDRSTRPAARKLVDVASQQLHHHEIARPAVRREVDGLVPPGAPHHLSGPLAAGPLDHHFDGRSRRTPRSAPDRGAAPVPPAAPSAASVTAAVHAAGQAAAAAVCRRGE